MRHVKIYTGALLVAGLIAGTAACGSSSGGTSGTSPSKTAQPAAAAEQQQQGGAEIATVRGHRIAVYRHKGDSAAWKTLSSPNEMGATRVFLVDAKD
ncbi:L,D-transpeptidase, partial [Nonomuraea sp. JJY05]